MGISFGVDSEADGAARDQVVGGADRSLRANVYREGTHRRCRRCRSPSGVRGGVRVVGMVIREFMVRGCAKRYAR